MKTVWLLIFLSIIVVGCGSKKENNAGNAASADSTAMRSSDDALLVEASQVLVNRFSYDLRTALTQAIAEQGAVGAISICRTLAPAIADSNSTHGWVIRRVSDKNRNPDNRTTLEEKEILARFVPEAPTPPEYLTVWDTTDSVTTFKYYEPIYVQPMCLKCHGDLQTLAPGVLDAVKKLYPDDKATGYKAGQLRGMFVIDVPWPDGLAYARQLVGDTTQVPADSL